MLDDVSDRLAIGELYARYCFAIDGDSIADFVACFTPDAVWTSTQAGTRKGRQEIGGVLAVMQARGSDRAIHTVDTFMIETLDGEAGTATARARWIAGYPLSGTCRFGQYRDDMVRGSDGVWRFAVRRLENLSPPRDE